jgi:drug/metabolite transporter (DMT)-like permease
MGVLLGVIVLREAFGRGRILGSCLIIVGLVLIALAP